MNTATSAQPPAPLTPEDFDALDDELDRMREHDDEIPQWEFCEGFLCALVCMRRELAPEEYWPVLLGEDFRPMEHMEFVWRWRRRWQEIASALDQPVEVLEDERTYHPEALDTRGAILALHRTDYLLPATFALATGLTLQTVLLLLWLLLRRRRTLRAILALWKPSLLAGLAGAAASEFWFLAFALATAASVRTLALVEVVFAQAVSKFVFKQKTTLPEAAGIALLLAGAVLIVRLS